MPPVVGRVDLGPAQLDVHRRSGDVEGGDRAAADRLIEEHRQVLRPHRAVGRDRVEHVHAELDGGGRGIDVDVVAAAGDEREVAVGIDRGGAHAAGIAGEPRLQFRDGGHFDRRRCRTVMLKVPAPTVMLSFRPRRRPGRQVFRQVRNAFGETQPRGQRVGRERIDLEIDSRRCRHRSAACWCRRRCRSTP